MYNIAWAVILWLLVFILIPFPRIKQLWPVALISAIWMFILNYIFIRLGYYQFTHVIVAIAGVPFFHVIGSAAGGILLMNWMQRSPLYKVFIVLLFSGFLNLASIIFMRLDSFIMLGGFNHVLHFAINIAGVSLLVWFSLALGEENIYEGKKTRFSF